MHLGVGQRDPGEGVAQGEAGVCPRCRVDQRSVGPLPEVGRHARCRVPAAERVDGVDQVALVVELGEGQGDADLAGHFVQPGLDLVQRRRAIQLGLAGAQQVQVRAVEDGDPHFGFSPCSHELNCSRSTGLPGSLAGGVGSTAPTSSDGVKNWSNRNF